MIVKRARTTSASQGGEKRNLQTQDADESSKISGESCVINCSRCEQQHCSYKKDSEQKCEQCEQQGNKHVRISKDNATKQGQTTVIQKPETRATNCQTNKKRYKTIMTRMIRCFVFLIFIATCCGLFFNQDIGGSKHNQNSHLFQSEFHKEVRLQTVPIEQFHKQLSNAKDFKDIFKIFLSDKNLSPSEIDGILRARTLESFLNRDARDEGYYNDEGDEYDETLADDAFAHYVEMNESPMGSCQYPQPEIVQVRAPYKKYIPSCTVLHRCRNVSGCCGEKQECGVATIEIVEKAFMVLGFADGEVSMTSESLERKAFVNHTRCKCTEKQGLDPCNKKCPHPYDVTRSGVSCMCKCPDNNNKCKKIRLGRKPLHVRDLKCIKEDKCYLPTCEYGDFNVKTGYCERLRHEHGHLILL